MTPLQAIVEYSAIFITIINYKMILITFYIIINFDHYNIYYNNIIIIIIIQYPQASGSNAHSFEQI